MLTPIYSLAPPVFSLASSFKTLSEDIRGLIDEPGFDDVVLKVDGHELACNKFLLCAR